MLWDALTGLLSDEPDAHQQALETIVSLGEEAVPVLEDLAVDDTAHPRHRAGAVFALGRIRSDSSEAVLQTLWERGLAELGGALTMQVASALAEYSNFQPLNGVLDSGDEILAAKAAIQLGLHRVGDSLAAISDSYERDDYARMRPFFAIALGLLGDGRGESVLREGLTVLELRNHCAVALNELGYGSEVLFELRFALSDGDPLVRLRALEALIELEPSDIVDLVDEATEDPDARIQEEAEAALRRLQRHQRR